MNQSVVRIPTLREVRVCPRHPEIERVVEKNVRQNWANHSPYTKGNLGRLSGLAVKNCLAVDSAGLECCGEW